MPAPLPLADLQCPQCGYALTGLQARICPECGVAFDPDELRRRSRHARRRRWIISALVMFGALYVPHIAWLMLIDYPWSDYHWFWISLLPATPTMLPMHFALNALDLEAGRGLGFWLLQGAGVSAWLLCTWIGTRGRWRWLIALSVVVLFLSIAEAFALCHAFLM